MENDNITRFSPRVATPSTPTLEPTTSEVSKKDCIIGSFQAAQEPPVHCQYPELQAVAIWDVLPDEVANCFEFGLVVSVW